MRQHDIKVAAPKAHPRTAQAAPMSPMTGLFGRQGQTLTHPDTVMAMQRTIGNTQAQRILKTGQPLQRDIDEDAFSEQLEGIQIDGQTVTTYEESLTFIQETGMQLAEYQTFFSRLDMEVPPTVSRTLKQAYQLIPRFNSQEGLISSEDMHDLVAWYEAYQNAEYDGRSAQSEILLGDLQDKRKKMKALQEAFKDMEPALRELQHKAFTSDDLSQAIVIGDAIAGYVGTVESITDTALKIETAYDHVQSWKSSKTLSFEMSELTKPGKQLFETIGNIKSTYEKFKDFSDKIELVMPKRTAKEELASTVTIMALMSDSGIKFGDKDILQTNLPLTGYPIGPMVENALKIASRINGIKGDTQRLGVFNEQWYAYVDWSNMMGGWEMFNFMRRVMQATDADGVPEPSEAVSSYFVNHAHSFSAALGGRSAVPMQGLLWFKSLNQDKIKSWAFQYRHDLWGALYGKAKVPS